MSWRPVPRGRLNSASSPFLVALATLFLLLSAACVSTPPSVPDQEMAQQGLVAVSQPLSAKAGAEILGKGGNAIDAAAAIQFALNVEEPMMSGIGGGGFMLIYHANTREVVAIDGRERAPMKATPDMFLGPDGKPLSFNEAHTGGNAVGVPGTLAGTVMALEKYGTMKLSGVLQPAIRMADEGIVVGDYFNRMLRGKEEKLGKEPGGAYSLFRPDGSLLEKGDMLVQKDLANAFRAIADQGIDVFYRGPIAEAISSTVKARGGRMELEDIATYAPVLREPVRGSYRGWEIASMPPPSSGGLTLIQMLKLLERFDMRAMGHNSPDTLHAMIEAMHLSYADRRKFMADSDFMEIPVKGLLEQAYVDQRSAMIDMSQSTPKVPPGDPWQYQKGERTASAEAIPISEGGQTTHFVVADRWGNVVAWTSTVEEVFGSGIMVPGYGFVLNNQMTNFDFRPGGANEIQPLKRPRSSITPTIVLKDGRAWMATGSPGGLTIITTTMQVIMNVVDHGMTIQEAVKAPRIFSSDYPTVQWEEGIPESVRAELESRGHDLGDKANTIGSAQSLVVDLETGRISGAADPRSQGTVISVPVVR